MRKYSERTIDCTNRVLNRPPRIRRFTGILGGILLLALLHDTVRAAGAVPSGSSVMLTWNANPSPSVNGYRVHYGTTSGDYTSSVAVGNTTTNTIPNLAAGVVYFFAVTALDTNGLESALSNEISFVPGQPAVQLLIPVSGQVVLAVNGLSGHTYEVLASQNLTTWAVIGTVTLGAGGPVAFTDTNASSFQKRFYRTRDTQP